MLSLEGLNIALIGGNGLIGKTLRVALGDLGAQVFIGSRTPKDSSPHHPPAIDIGDEPSVQKFFHFFKSRQLPLDVLINVALPPMDYEKSGWEKLSTEKFQLDMNSHLGGYYNCLRYAMMLMKEQRHGSIINFGSIYGEVSPDFRIYEGTSIERTPPYSLIKAGIHMMSKYFAVVGAPENIRVNTIAPGGIFDNHCERFEKQYSSRVPMGRMGRPEDLVAPVVMFSHPSSSYITGQCLFIDGGLTAL